MDLAEILTELGYTSEWLEWGIVEKQYLEVQYSEFCRSHDKNQEHYRCRAFADFLGRYTQMTDELVDRVLRLTDSGPDKCDLRINRMFALIGSRILSDEQHFALAGRYPRFLEPALVRLYRRESILRKIRRSGLADRFSEIQASEDKVLQVYVLDHPEVERNHLQWLTECGANKRIRNRAAAMLRSRKFRGNQR